MSKPFSSIISQIDEALQSKELTLAGRLFFEATEAASKQGMILGFGDDELILELRENRSDKPPFDIVENGTLVGLLIEDSGHKLHRPGIVHNAEEYLELLMRYASQTLSSNDQYKITKPRLMLYIQSGAYYGACILAQAALTAIQYEHHLETVAMHFNIGSIHIHLEQTNIALDSYQTALDLARRYNAPVEIVNTIQRNIQGITTGYDPDFIFLPDSAIRLPNDYTAPRPVKLKDVSLTPKLTVNNDNNITPESIQLVLAARANEFDKVHNLLQKGCNVNVRDKYGGTALMYAVAAHDEDAIKILLSYDADVNLSDTDGRTALFYSILWHCPYSIVKLLVENRAKVNLKDKEGNTALMLATMFPYEEERKKKIVELLRNAERRGR